MRRLLLPFALTALAVPFSACSDNAPADDGNDPEASLPGDIDNSNDSLGGKADAWDYTNDPARLARNLVYTLADLPRTGKLESPVWKDRYPSAVGKAPVAWADTYWPSIEGSTNVRWQGPDTKSPLEKYDAAFNGVAGCENIPSELCGADAKANWGAYFQCAGPAARWQIEHFQSISEQIDGVDNDNDGEIDECDGSDDEGTQGWWGLCHAWTPAALLEPEPQNGVTYNGVHFDVADIKALVQTVYDSNEALMLGGRCNEKTFSPDNTVGGANSECDDTNPGAMHVVITNFIGINDSALAFDKTASFQVWNQPIIEYEIRQQDKITATQANTCVGATGDTWTFNTWAKELYEVEMSVTYLVEGSADREPLGLKDYTRSESYHYVLEVGQSGKVIGGRYCTDSAQNHPDFLWAPIKVATSSSRRNPYVTLDKVQTLLNLSFQNAAPSPSGAEKTFQVTTPTAVPDADLAGVTVDLPVAEQFSFSALSVSVDIKHSWRGDLLVTLLKDGQAVQTLADRTGGSAHDITQTWTFQAADVGGAQASGTWSLKVVDDASGDVGTVNLFKLAFATAN